MGSDKSSVSSSSSLELIRRACIVANSLFSGESGVGEGHVRCFVGDPKEGRLREDEVGVGFLPIIARCGAW